MYSQKEEVCISGVLLELGLLNIFHWLQMVSQFRPFVSKIYLATVVPVLVTYRLNYSTLHGTVLEECPELNFIQLY